MNASRLAVWIVGAAVCGAWLASAAGVTRQARATRSIPRPPDAVSFDLLAADVQAQAGRLRERLSNAPAPRATDRNPFSFEAPPVPRPAVAARAQQVAVAVPTTVEIREPVLELIGIAESGAADTPVRTAMITGGYDELMMVTVGARILGRYDVIAIAGDAVDLKDLQTGAIRRLVLR